MARVTLKINGLNDAQAEAAISNIIRELSGVTQVKTYANHHTADVSFSDGRLSVEEMKQAINVQGYYVEE